MMVALEHFQASKLFQQKKQSSPRTNLFQEKIAKFSSIKNTHTRTESKYSLGLSWQCQTFPWGCIIIFMVCPERKSIFSIGFRVERQIYEQIQKSVIWLTEKVLIGKTLGDFTEHYSFSTQEFNVYLLGWHQNGSSVIFKLPNGKYNNLKTL